jgi:hypothetical protein
MPSYNVDAWSSNQFVSLLGAAVAAIVGFLIKVSFKNDGRSGR